MKKSYRFLFVLVLVICILALSGGALAGFVPAVEKADLKSSKIPNPFTGTGVTHVTEPEKESVLRYTSGAQSTRSYSINGCATITIQSLSQGSNWNAYETSSPTTTQGDILSCAVNLEYTTSGTARVCFAVPPEKTGKIFLWDTSTTPPTETVMETTVANGMACAPANQNGVYALVSQ